MGDKNSNIATAASLEGSKAGCTGGGDSGRNSGSGTRAWGQRIQTAAYWEERYTKDLKSDACSGDGNNSSRVGEDSSSFLFEWYVDWSCIEELLVGSLHRGAASRREMNVLEIGCGSSRLAIDMALQGALKVS